MLNKNAVIKIYMKNKGSELKTPEKCIFVL